MAAPTDNQVLEKAVGGLPIVALQGLNTNKAVNFSGTQVDTSGNLTIASGAAISGTAGIGTLNLTTAPVTGPTGTTAALGPTGAADSGPATAAQAGWTKIFVAGVAAWVPFWQ
jgi:hypothetical protein